MLYKLHEKDTYIRNNRKQRHERRNEVRLACKSCRLRTNSNSFLLTVKHIDGESGIRGIKQYGSGAGGGQVCGDPTHRAFTYIRVWLNIHGIMYIDYILAVVTEKRPYGGSRLHTIYRLHIEWILYTKYSINTDSWLQPWSPLPSIHSPPYNNQQRLLMSSSSNPSFLDWIVSRYLSRLIPWCQQLLIGL